MTEQYQVKPLKKPMQTVVTVPGSKSMTNRALLLAALAGGKSIIRGVLFSDDSRHFMDCLCKLGFSTSIDEALKQVTICGEGGKIPFKKAEINVGSAGTAARFLTALTGLSDGEYQINSSEQMKKRPMKELFLVLSQLGAEITYLEEDYSFPVIIRGAAREGAPAPQDKVRLNIDRSSQFLSALLLTSPMLKNDLTIELTGTRSAVSYVNMSQKMMKEFGYTGEITKGCEKESGYTAYHLPAGKNYESRDYQVEPDVSAACYFYAMAALTGGEVVVRHVTENSSQGDLRFIQVLEQLGCQKSYTQEGFIRLTGPAGGKYPGISVNMSDFSDQTMTLAALAPFADSPVTISGVGHIRGQETNRIAAICNELGRMEIVCEEKEDGMVIYPGEPKPCVVETYNDHRMAMAFSLIGLRVSGIIIDNPACCGKTFENYFALLDELTDGTEMEDYTSWNN